ncbi:MAG: hypothetical protein JGK21_31375, partial [Microcoleus sp. PH2017_22_RUC_O_B]
MMKRSRSINLDKDTTRRPSPPEQFDAVRKATPATPEVGMLGVSGTRELGAFGGISGVSDVAVGVQELPLPGVSIEINPVEQSAKAEVDIGIKQGFGVNFGGEVKRTPTGISVENVSFGVNVLGFGVNAKGKGNESGSLGVSAFGISVDVANDKDGKTSVRLGLSLPGISTGITLAPDGQKETSTEQPIDSIQFPPGSDRHCVIPINKKGYTISTFPGWGFTEHREWEVTVLGEATGFSSSSPSWNIKSTQRSYEKNKTTGAIFSDRKSVTTETIWLDTATSRNSEAFRTPTGRNIYTNGFVISGRESDIYEYMGSQMNNSFSVPAGNPANLPFPRWSYAWSHSIEGQSRHKPSNGICYVGGEVEPSNTPNLILVAQNLPNYPQKYKPMNCCDKVEEIYKYLGIAKMKKKFKVAKQFLVPGGKGNE